MFTLLYIQLFSCSDKAEQTCTYNDEVYEVGASFPAGDGCNTCSCEEIEGETMMSCTEIGCADPEPMSCAEMNTETCEEVALCTVIYASPIAYVEADECYVWANEVEAVGCIDADMGCTSELKHGASLEDPNNCYGFGGCMPENWGDCGLGDYPECP